jgi:RNA polymerase sigma-70 factor (ECF subfamily)
MQRYLDGDSDALNRLYARYWRRLYHYCLSILKHPDDAEDAAMNAWHQVARVARSGSYRQQGSVCRWLTTIARHAAIDLYRKRRPNLALDSADEIFPEPEAHGHDLELRVTLARFFDTLTDEELLIVKLKHVNGLSQTEIARVLGTTGCLISRRVATIRDRWVRFLAEEDGDAGDCARLPR